MLDSDHAGVHLAGRCRDLVVLDASLVEDPGAGILIEPIQGAVTVSGIEVTGPFTESIVVGSGDVSLVDLRILGASGAGLYAWRTSMMAGVDVSIEGSEIVDSGIGLVAMQDGVTVQVSDSVITCASVAEDDGCGYGALVFGGADLSLESSAITDRRGVGLIAQDSGTELVLRNSSVASVLPGEGAEPGYGVYALSGAAVTIEDSEIADNRAYGLAVTGSGTVVEARDSTILRTITDASGTSGLGLYAESEAEVHLERCHFVENSEAGIWAYGASTRVIVLDSRVEGSTGRPGCQDGYGIVAQGGPVVELIDSEVARNTTQGIMALNEGTELILRGTTIRDTQPAPSGFEGLGVGVYDSAMLRAEGCVLAGNHDLGLEAQGDGTVVELEHTVVRGTQPAEDGSAGYGADITFGAVLDAVDCEVVDNYCIGVRVMSYNSAVSLRGTTIRDTRAHVLGVGGYGLQASHSSTVALDRCAVSDNVSAGIVAHGNGTTMQIRDSIVNATQLGTGELESVAIGLVAQWGAEVGAERLVVQGSRGPGLYVYGSDALLRCGGCSLVGNRFAGAAVGDDGLLELVCSVVSDTEQSVNLGGGVGIWAGDVYGEGPATLLVEDSIIANNLLAGVHLSGQGEHVLVGNLITGSVAEAHGATTRCGDGVRAVGVTASNGGGGLTLRDNTFVSNQGAGLFLDDAHAELFGNEWIGGEPDLWLQGSACLTAGDAYSEVPVSVICPEWDEPSCDLGFSLMLHADDVVASLVPPPRRLVLADITPRGGY